MIFPLSLMAISAAAWIFIRHQAFIEEKYVPLMWAITVSSFGILTFLGFANEPVAQNVVFPIVLGPIVGELAWVRIQRWLVRMKEKEQAHQAALAAEKRRRRKARKAKEEAAAQQPPEETD